MKMSKIAIYARKSVFREDSISIESQIEMCKYEAHGEECVVYQDNGFSGKNTDRPDFQKMMNDIILSKISKVIVVLIFKLCKCILPKELTILKIQSKRGNAEERPCADCGILR